MAPVSLKKLIGRKNGLGDILMQLAKEFDSPVSILDSSGQLLLSPYSSNSPPGGKPVGKAFPILQENQEIGRVSGGDEAATLAALLSYLVNQESEKRALATEVLERYRELNLLYNLSNKLAANPQPDAIASVALDEATHLIRAIAGMIVICAEGEEVFKPVAIFGTPCQLAPGRGIAGGLVERTLQSGKGDIANDIPAAEFLCDTAELVLSLIAAPLKTEKRILGALILANEGDNQYTARDLKLLNTIAQQVAPAIEIAHLYQVALEKARMEHELQMAYQVQVGLLPRAMPELDGWAFSAAWRPARIVSGDFFDLIPEKEGHLGLVIADVTDKSLAAALFMAFTRSVLRASLDRYTTPVEGLSRANQLVCLESNQGLFVTLFYAHLDLETGDVTYVNAGHNPALHYLSRQGRLEGLTLTGLPLGIEQDAAYEQKITNLNPGDFIFFYTDGVTETFNTDEDQFGVERLQEVLLANRNSSTEEILQAVQNAVAAFSGRAELSDDITMLVVKRSGNA